MQTAIRHFFLPVSDMVVTRACVRLLVVPSLPQTEKTMLELTNQDANENRIYYSKQSGGFMFLAVRWVPDGVHSMGVHGGTPIPLIDVLYLVIGYG